MDNDLIIEIGLDDFPINLKGLIQRSIEEKLIKTTILNGINYKSLKVESIKSRFIILMKDVELNVELVNTNMVALEDILKETILEVLNSVAVPNYDEKNKLSCSFMDYISWVQCILQGNIFYINEDSINDTNRESKRLVKYSNYSEYEMALEENSILLEAEKRREYFKVKAKKLAMEYNGELSNFEHLVERYVNTQDYPFPYIGKIDEKFLTLPIGIISTILTVEFEVIPVITESGKSTVFFIGSTEKTDKDNCEIISKVVTLIDARLGHILELFSEDLDKEFAEYVEDLKNLPYHFGVATYYEKTSRVVDLSTQIASILNVPDETIENVKREAFLSKADLATKIVLEIPSLRGVIGRIYSSKYGEKEVISKAIGDQYKPRSYKDELPESTSGKILGLADKFDYIVSYFISAQDDDMLRESRELRTAALGFVQIIIGSKFQMNLDNLIRDCLYTHVKYSNFILEYDKLSKKIGTFIILKLREELIRMGYQFHIIDGVIEVASNDIYEIYMKVNAVSEIGEASDNEFFNLVKSMQNKVDEMENEISIESDDVFIVELRKLLDFKQYHNFLFKIWDNREILYDICENEDVSPTLAEVNKLIRNVFAVEVLLFI